MTRKPDPTHFNKTASPRHVSPEARADVGALTPVPVEGSPATDDSGGAPFASINARRRRLQEQRVTPDYRLLAHELTRKSKAVRSTPDETAKALWGVRDEVEDDIEAEVDAVDAETEYWIHHGEQMDASAEVHLDQYDNGDEA